MLAQVLLKLFLFIAVKSMSLVLHARHKPRAGRAQRQGPCFSAAILFPFHTDLRVAQLFDAELDIGVVPLRKVVLQTVDCLAPIFLHVHQSEVGELVHARHWVVWNCGKFVVFENPLKEVFILRHVDALVTLWSEPGSFIQSFGARVRIHGRV